MRIGNGVIAAWVAFLLLAAAPAEGRNVRPEALDRIKPGVTTAKEVEQILGPPAARSNFPRLGLVSMDYEMRHWGDSYDVGVMIGRDGIVRDVQRVVRHRAYG